MITNLMLHVQGWDSFDRSTRKGTNQKTISKPLHSKITNSFLRKVLGMLFHFKLSLSRNYRSLHESRFFTLELREFTMVANACTSQPVRKISLSPSFILKYRRGKEHRFTYNFNVQLLINCCHKKHLKPNGFLQWESGRELNVKISSQQALRPIDVFSVRFQHHLHIRK